MKEDDLQKAVVRLDVDPAQAERFWDRCDRSGGAESCWPFSGACMPSGYGVSKWPVFGSRRVDKAHRIAFLISNGWLPLGRTKGSLVIRHTCDNPVCCNPNHLLTGTHKQNQQDAIERGRAVEPPVGLRDLHPRAKLTMTAARMARKLHRDGTGCAELARRFRVGETTMGHLLAGRTWREPSHGA